MTVHRPTLENKVALVTGGSRGLGYVIAEAYASAGADVIISSRNLDSCKVAAQTIAGSTRRTIVPIACHVGHWDDATALVASAYDLFDRVDILVNNAGIAPTYPSLAEVTEDLFDKTIGVNLKGPFRLAALLGDRMVEGGGGVIINVSSVAAIRPKPTDLVYAAAKAGLEALTAGLARAYGPSVRVNSLMPGPFLTDIARHWDMEVVGARHKTYALGRAGRPAEIAGAALYLASDAASFTTGSVLRVDGGMGIA